LFDLDFSLLPQILRHRLFMGIPPYIEEPLSKLHLPETLDRLRGASHFFDEVTTTLPEWRNRSLLRAALSEFRSVGQALSWDLGRRAVYSPDNSRNPLIHLVLRFRRLAVYVANAQMVEREVAATFELGEHKTTSDIKLVLIQDVYRYLSQERLTGYRPADVLALCEWFEANQAEWGAPQVLNIGIMQYGLELATEYAHREGEQV
jgi:hypothetical protein